MLSTFLSQKKSEPLKGELHFFISCNPLPCAQNFKPEFELQILLAQNAPSSTSEPLPFGSNLDSLWDYRFLEIPLRDSYFSRCGLLDFYFLGEIYVFTHLFSTSRIFRSTSCFISWQSLFAHLCSIRCIFRSKICSISWYSSLTHPFSIIWIFISMSCLISWRYSLAHWCSISWIVI